MDVCFHSNSLLLLVIQRLFFLHVLFSYGCLSLDRVDQTRTIQRYFTVTISIYPLYLLGGLSHRLAKIRFRKHDQPTPARLRHLFSLNTTGNQRILPAAKLPLQHNQILLLLLLLLS